VIDAARLRKVLALLASPEAGEAAAAAATVTRMLAAGGKRPEDLALPDWQPGADAALLAELVRLQRVEMARLRRLADQHLARALLAEARLKGAGFADVPGRAG
jgi:hypothetical protein